MNLRKQTENFNEFLSEVFDTPMKFSDILYKQGFTDEEIGVIKNNLPAFFDQVLSVLKETFTVRSTGSTRRAEIVFKRFGLNSERKTLKEIGEEKHLSRERIRQLEEKSMKKIRSKKYIDIFEVESERIARGILNSISAM